MVIVFANNQVIAAEGGGGAVQIWTDPVPLGDADRATCVLNCHYMVGGSAPRSLGYQPEVSNDGVSWVNQGALQSIAAAGPAVQAIINVDGAFIRFRYEYSANGAGLSAACFDLHVLLDHR